MKCPNCGYRERRDEGVKRIIKEACAEWDVEAGELLGKSKTRRFFPARRWAMKEMEALGLTHSEIGVVFSNRVHSVVTRCINESYVVQARSKVRPVNWVRARAILREVAEERGLTTAGVVGPRRTAAYASARREVARRCTYELGMTRMAVGELLSRDHSSITMMLVSTNSGQLPSARRRATA